MASRGRTDAEGSSMDLAAMEAAYSRISFPIAVFDNRGDWMFLNPAALELCHAPSLADIKGAAGDDWGGRLSLLASAARDTAEPSMDDPYYIEARSGKIFSRCVSAWLDGSGKPAGTVESLYDVTSLFETEERTRAIIDAMPLCCSFWDESLQNVYCNREAVRLYNLPDEKTYLDRFFELSPVHQPNGNKSSDEALKHVARAFKEGFDRFEWMHQKLNGEPVPAEITLMRIKQRKGDIVLACTRDLRSSRSVSEVDDLDWLTNVLDSLPFPTGVANASGKWLFLNQAGLKFFGKSNAEELSDTTAFDWGGRLRPVAVIPGEGAECHVDKQTDQIYRRVSSSLRDNFGNVVGRIECIHDVTTLYEAEERIRAMVDAAPLCCNFWDESFQNIDCNREAAKLFDLPDEKAYLERFFELSPEYQPDGNKSSDEAFKHISKAFKEGFDRFEWMHQKLNGDPVPAEITLVRVKQRKGNVVLGYTRDLRRSAK